MYHSDSIFTVLDSRYWIETILGHSHGQFIKWTESFESIYKKRDSDGNAIEQDYFSTEQ